MRTLTPLRGFLDRLRGWWKHLPRRSALIWLGTAPLLVLLILAFAWDRCFFAGCPDVEGLAAWQPGGSPVLLDRHGEVFADLTPVEREVVPLFELPAHVPQAFLAVEDQRFYEHEGIDWRRVGGAVLANVRAGGFEQGFSTITMQLARNAFPEEIPGQDRSTSRKLLEVRVAQEIEARYSKQEILELYLNHIYFGNRARGIEAAARQYFNVSAKELTLPQAALLAALPKAPSHYDPRSHPDKARQRRDLVLRLMQEQGRIPRRVAEEARDEPLGITRAPRQRRVESGLAPWFVEQVRQELEARFGSGLYRQPLRIWTTLDSRVQRAAEEELARQLRRVERGDLGAFEGRAYSPAEQPGTEGTPYLQGALVAMDARQGDILAWVGGRNYAHSQFDRAVLARRQAGSAFKPFLYAAALREGYVLSQPLQDRPLSLRMSDGRVWKPRNFTGRYEGEITLRDALVQSKNVVSVRLAQALGLGRATALARQAGIERVPQVPSVALGTVAVSPLELTAAYTAFASLGEVVEPRKILRVEDEEGRVIWQSSPRRERVLDPGVAYLISDVLADAVRRGTGTRALAEGLRVPAAGKTGTTNAGADAWFVGYTPEIAAGIWIGFDRPRAIVDEATGGRLAAPVWGRVMERLYREREVPAPWRAPQSVVARQVEPATGLLLEEGCEPVEGEPYRELFLQSFQPAAWCPGEEPPPEDGFPATRRREAAPAPPPRVAEKPDEPERPEEEQAERTEDEEEAAEAERERRELEEERIARLEEAEHRLEEREAEIARQEREREARREREREEERAREGAEAEAEAEPEPEEPREPAEPQEETAADLSGWWEMTNRIEESNLDRYEGLRLGYRLHLEQDGNRITGRGQKWSEEGRTLPASARTPITVSGTIDGRAVELSFVEHGNQRITNGGFTWTLAQEGTLRGSFWSTAADTRGRSTAARMP